MRLRFGLRSKLLLLSGFLFTIPWFGYQYVWEMEKYLRFGQEQTIIGTARALATALHERANLFNNQASFLPSVEKGKDLYGYQLKQAIKLDGSANDWPNYHNKSHYYGFDNQIFNQINAANLTLNFTAAVGKYDKFLYFFLRIVDDKLIYRDKNARSIRHNDHIELAFTEPDGSFNRYLLSNKTSGWLDAYKITSIENNIPAPVSFIQGHWQQTPEGYNLEFRIPLTKISDNIAFTVNDVDENLGDINSTIGSADPTSIETLGTILVPSPEIERIVKGMSYTNSSIWVVDQHRRVLAKAGDINKANGLWQKNKANHNNDNAVLAYLNNWLQPLYDIIFNKPQSDFIDQLYDAQTLTGKHIESALQGVEKSQWRLTTDQKAVILSAAYPIFIGNKVNGAVIVEETTNGILTVRNQALEKLFSSILAIMLLGALAFFFFASRISNRIRLLRNQAESSIDEHGRINNALTPSTTNDEIGDLSRSFSTAVNRLSQYNHYLENMSSRLSHELRTPIAVVRTSLENLSMQEIPSAAEPYIERAQTGIQRLNLILTNMSEATRIEQMLHSTEKVDFNFNQVLSGCVQGYRQIYPESTFNLTTLEPEANSSVSGSPEHIAQLLDKVIANAVEFSEDNNINIVLEATQHELILHVSNNGALLPEQMKERLFDSMVSMRSADKQSQPHLGLGLYIARLIVEFHQGKITANDHHNPKGVTISIQVPMNKAN
ncbi:MAG: proteobacterial dedicated sortase system histidine kinase [Colwellia sp.]|nr:proteobacterial dedicated sortase system histidine kinase [Colwellia sp.]